MLRYQKGVKEGVDGGEDSREEVGIVGKGEGYSEVVKTHPNIPSIILTTIHLRDRNILSRNLSLPPTTNPYTVRLPPTTNPLYSALAAILIFTTTVFAS